MQVQFELTHMEHRALRSFMDHEQIVNTSFAVRIALCDWLIVSDVPAPPFALGREGRCSKPLRASTYADFRVYA